MRRALIFLVILNFGQNLFASEIYCGRDSSGSFGIWSATHSTYIGAKYTRLEDCNYALAGRNEQKKLVCGASWNGRRHFYNPFSYGENGVEKLTVGFGWRDIEDCQSAIWGGSLQAVCVPYESYVTIWDRFYKRFVGEGVFGNLETCNSALLRVGTDQICSVDLEGQIRIYSRYHNVPLFRNVYATARECVQALVLE